MFYLSVMGATWNGVLMPPLKWLNLALIAGLALLWLLARRRGHWTWHRNPLDGPLLLWALAFGVALLANPESWRRMVMGLWYVSLYVGVWFVLADALANRVNDSEAKVVVTSDGAPRGGRVTELKDNVNKALLHCDDHVKCLVVKRTGQQVAWIPERDVW
ncbi:MAG: hypothetical protein ACOCZH_06425, partial [Phototrophicaceae bacterium]